MNTVNFAGQNFTILQYHSKPNFLLTYAPSHWGREQAPSAVEAAVTGVCTVGTHMPCPCAIPFLLLHCINVTAVLWSPPITWQPSFPPSQLSQVHRCWFSCDIKVANGLKGRGDVRLGSTSVWTVGGVSTYLSEGQ